jgi:hypothetical protein
MKITQVTTFIFGDGTRVEFYPITDAPGFTHKVYVLRDFKVAAKDWFSPVAGRISKKVARFYFEKHREAQ